MDRRTRLIATRHVRAFSHPRNLPRLAFERGIFGTHWSPAFDQITTIRIYIPA
jgi:hypothetical protein